MDSHKVDEKLNGMFRKLGQVFKSSAASTYPSKARGEPFVHASLLFTVLHVASRFGRKVLLRLYNWYCKRVPLLTLLLRQKVHFYLNCMS